MKVYLGADHGGFPLKEKVKAWLTAWKVTFEDKGAYTLDPEDDYPQFAFAVAEVIGPKDRGIIVCRSAAGLVIAANKVPGVRAVAVFDERGAINARTHNDANVLGLSADWTDEKTTEKIIKAFLKTEFSKEARHKRRLGQIEDYEQSCCGGDSCGDCS